jgi:hypothetical protein
MAAFFFGAPEDDEAGAEQVRFNKERPGISK